MGEHDPETDRLLEQELREAVGEQAAERAMEHADDVKAAHAAPGTPAARDDDAARPIDAADAAPAPRGRLTSWATAHGAYVAVSFLVLLTIGVVISLATGSWWALVAAITVHAIGTLVVAATALRLITETEHVSPALAARLEGEGVQDPDRAFTELVAGGAAPGDVVRDGRNERTADAEDDAARAAREQRTAMTPGSEPTQPSDGGRTVGLMPPAVVIGSLVVALVAAVVVGEPALWGAAAIAWLTGGAWLLLTRRGVPERRSLLVAGLVAIPLAVAIFGVLMGVLSDRL